MSVKFDNPIIQALNNINMMKEVIIIIIVVRITILVKENYFLTFGQIS